MNVQFSRAPAFRAALLMACGILLADALSVPPGPLLAGSLISSALLLLLHWPVEKFSGRVFAPLLCLTAGLSLGAGDRRSLPALPDDLLGSTAGLMGTVEEISRRDDRRLRMVLEDALIVAESSVVPVRGAILVSLVRGRADPEYPAVRIGMQVRARGILYPVSGPRNPGEFDSRRWAAANGIAGELAGRSPDEMTVLDSSGGRSFRSLAVYPLRRELLGAIDNMIGGEEGEFLKGLLIGERSGISPGVNEDFIRAGVAHVLAVSGSNVAVVAGFFGFLLSMTGLGRTLRSLLLTVFLIVYMLLSGAQPPVVRATIMAVAALAAVAVGERVNVLNALGVSALVILAINSQTLFDVGFQLSFAAVLSLIVLYPPLSSAISCLRGNAWWRRALRGGLRVMAVTVAATLGTLPLTAGVFGRASLIGIAANIVVVPATGVSVLLGGVMLLLTPLSHDLASLYGAANWGALRFTLWFTHLCAVPGWASLDMPWFRTMHTLPFAAGLFTVFSWGRPSRFRASLIVTVGLLFLTVGGPALSPAGSPRLRLTMLDVGQGDAILIDTPHGAHLLVDCGPASPEFDAGKRTILPFLARERIDTLDWLVVTHEHRDHVGGLHSLLAAAPVRTIGAPAHYATALSGEIGREVRSLEAGDVIDLDQAIRCYVLSPSPAAGPVHQTGGNDGSVVLRVQYGSTRLLLVGDAGFAAEDAMVERFGTFLRTDCLKVGHHGSLTSTGDRFLSLVAPSVSLISAGRNNRFRHPATATVAKLRVRGGLVRRTDLSGATVIESDGNSLLLLR
jgi:competence protein ComEC